MRSMSRKANRAETAKTALALTLRFSSLHSYEQITAPEILSPLIGTK
jgi:hypothetical protein